MPDRGEVNPCSTLLCLGMDVGSLGDFHFFIAQGIRLWLKRWRPQKGSDWGYPEIEDQQSRALILGYNLGLLACNMLNITSFGIQDS